MDILSSDSLIAPLDALRFILAYAILLLVPGYSMAALLRPRSTRLERLSLATPCAYSLVAISGLVTALLHLSYGAAQYAAVALPVTVAGAYATWRARTASDDGARTTDRWWLVAAAVAIVQTGAVAFSFIRETVPAGFDVLAHVIWVEQIGKAHVFPIALMSSNLGSNEGAFYPPVFHVICAMVQSLAPMPAYRVTFFVELAAVATLPLVLFTYTRVATGSDRLAGLATIAALAFEPLPFFSVIQGLYTFIVSMVFVPALALALRDGLGQGDRRSVLLAALLGAGLFYTHPTEFVTVGVLTLAITPGLLRDLRSWGRAAGYGLLVAAAWFIVAFPALRAVHQTISTGAQAEMSESKVFTPATHVDLMQTISIYIQFVFGRNLGYVLLVATLIGLVWCLIQGRYLGLVAAQLILSALFVDSVSYNILHRFYALSFPWALWERLAPTHYWMALPLAAVGIDVAARALRRALQTKAVAFVSLAATPVIVVGLLLPLGVATARATSYNHARDIMAPADIHTIAWLAAHTPQSAVVVNDADIAHMDVFDAPLDAGRWMPILGGPQPLFWRSATGPGPLDQRMYVLHHIGDNPLPSRVREYLERYGVRYVFYGARIRPMAQRHLRLSQLLGSPFLSLVYSSAPTCTALDRRVGPACPLTGSYVFAIHMTSLAGRMSRTG